MKSVPIVIKAKLDTFEKWAEISKNCLCFIMSKAVNYIVPISLQSIGTKSK